jgi:hypothetical protein
MVTLTHKGWFLACPILAGDIKSEEPTLVARRFVPDWWFEANALAMQLAIALRSLLQPGYDGHFLIMFTGELEEPIEIRE